MPTSNPNQRLVEITIDGVPIPTRIGEDGIQRLPNNGHMRSLVDSGALDLDGLQHQAVIGDLTWQTVQWVFINIGISVGRFAAIFPSAVIQNPVWEGEPES